MKKSYSFAMKKYFHWKWCLGFWQWNVNSMHSFWQQNYVACTNILATRMKLLKRNISLLVFGNERVYSLKDQPFASRIFMRKTFTIAIFVFVAEGEVWAIKITLIAKGLGNNNKGHYCVAECKISCSAYGSFSLLFVQWPPLSSFQFHSLYQ